MNEFPEFYEKQATIGYFLLCAQTETPEVWFVFFRKLYLGVLHLQIKLSTYNIPQANYSHLLQYC